ncbi:hypothetical protein ACHAQA_003319 [Verticillium albo-atrum]
MATFHLFPRLPAELRLRIWELAVQPRLLVLKYAPDSTIFISPTPPPAITHACGESRNLGPYRKAFTTNGTCRYAWANFDFDTIHIDCQRICRNDLARDVPERSSIKHIQAEITSEDLSWIDQSTVLFSSQGFTALPQLQSFDLLVNFDLAMWTGFIRETYFGAKCPRSNVRVIHSLTGEWVNEKTSVWYEDWYQTQMTDFEPMRDLEDGEDGYYTSEVCPSEFMVPWTHSPLEPQQGPLDELEVASCSEKTDAQI